MKQALPVYESYSRFADVYDMLMQDVRYDEWAAYIAGLLADYAPGAKNIADCACGTGAFSVRLQKRGFRVVGVDRSEDMLRIAQTKARQAGLQIPFVRQDMRALQLHKPVDAINCACDGVNYLLADADAAAFFAAAYAALKPGGVLLFDISSAYKLEHVLGQRIYGDNNDACAYVWLNRYDPHARITEMALSFFVRREDGAYSRFDELHRQRAYTAEELSALLAGAGFTTVHVFGAETRQPPAQDAQRLQFVALRT